MDHQEHKPNSSTLQMYAGQIQMSHRLRYEQTAIGKA